MSAITRFKVPFARELLFACVFNLKRGTKGDLLSSLQSSSAYFSLFIGKHQT